MTVAVDNPPPLLSVRDLRVDVVVGRRRTQPIVRGISFDVRRGEFLGIVGESGSGKTLGLLGMAGLVEHVARSQVSGEAVFEGVDLLKRTPEELRRMQGRDIGFVFQKARAALNPTLRVGTQIAEAIRAHEDAPRADAWARAVEALELVEIPRAAERARAYPHEFSGGMAQRVAIAMAIACRPSLLIADEPTTALDATVQLDVLTLIDSLRSDLGMAVLLVTHDLALVRRFATSILVVYGGRVVEHGPTASVFAQPGHPYTWKLMEASPALDTVSERLEPVPGEVPAPSSLPSGCAFRTRCFLARDECAATLPPLIAVGRRTAAHDGEIDHAARCLFTADLDRHRVAEAAGEASAPAREPLTNGRDSRSAPHPAIRLERVTRTFDLGRPRLFGKREKLVAVDDVSLEVQTGEILGLVGESGSGKTTLASLIVRLLTPDAGEIWIGDREVTRARGGELRGLRGDIQMVFQDPGGSLNPKMTVGACIAEPLRIRGLWGPEGERRRADLMRRVGLPTSYVERYPHELSGGQQQRVGIARALILQPSVLLLDEPTSSLDVSIQAQVLQLLLGLQEELGLTCVFISHDLALVRRICHRVAVMYRGRLVELDDVERVFEQPSHSYTASLIAASTLAAETRDARVRPV